MKEERSLMPNSKQEKPHWRVSFGFWTELDLLFYSFPTLSKPRCPALLHDSNSEWYKPMFIPLFFVNVIALYLLCRNKRLVPDDIGRFLGNPAAAACLRAITLTTEADAVPAYVNNFIISGGHHTGKSTFAGILRKKLLSLTEEQPCRFATLNASEFVDKILPSKLEDAVKRLDASKTGSVSYLTIERFESVTPSVQQHFFVPLLAEANSKKVYMILLVRPDTNKLAEQIKAQAMKVHLHPLSPDLVRTKLLHICQQERIGYTREGLEELMKLCSFKLMPCLDMLHGIFLKHYFISHANVVKVGQPVSGDRITSSPIAAPPFPLSILRMSEPLRRCPKCTLIPPCSHVSLEKLYFKIDQVRSLYPNTVSAEIAKPRDATCPSFGRRGICTNIQKLGRCRYAHPLDLHAINTTALVPRCRVHTLPLPCLHCTNAEQLKGDVHKAIAMRDRLKRELLRSRQGLADLEAQRYLFARDRSKTTKWGGAKRIADEQLARMDATISSSKSSIQSQEQALSSHEAALESLQEAIVHGRSKGLGKGRGREENRSSSSLT
ncbi:hypothetical protein P3T76_003661 [Phytophthora citrophthora]|uniref:C3H1-type domain-containing protein n=1 Tax=Phytophthora citrophthora TaxID=4793 RepID=A0AAD9LPP4_9STRA|nr:hypothetical protein P3T76_003661 [Phytophthora citrophthora]